MSVLLRAFYSLIPHSYYDWPLSHLPGGEVVVDMGAGPGILASRLQALYSYVVAVDIDEGLIRMHSIPGGDRVIGSACMPPLRGSSADAVVFHDALHHLEEPERGIEEACSLLKPGGLLAVFDFDLSKLSVKALRLMERLLGFPANFLDRHTLVRLVERCGRRVDVREGPFGSLAVLAAKD